MLNLLHADGYRLVHGVAFWLCLAACVLIPALPLLAALLSPITEALGIGFLEVGAVTSPLPNFLGPYGIIALLAGMTVLFLVTGDAEQRALKSLACVPAVRRTYMLAKLVMLIALAALYTAVMCAVSYVVPLLLGQPPAPVDAGAFAVEFAGNVLVCVALCALPLAVACMGAPAHIMTWYMFLAALGVVDMFIMMLLSGLSLALPGLSEVLVVLVASLPVYAVNALKYPAELMGDAMQMTLVFAVPLIWTLIGLAVGTWAMRRRALG